MKKLNEQEMAAYVAERVELISDKKRESFEQMSVEDQYKAIKKLEAAKRFADKKKAGVTATKSGLVDKVRTLFEKSRVSTTDVDDVIAFCETFKTEIVENQIKNIDEQIAELQALRDELSK